MRVSLRLCKSRMYQITDKARFGKVCRRAIQPQTRAFQLLAEMGRAMGRSKIKQIGLLLGSFCLHGICAFTGLRFPAKVAGIVRRASENPLRLPSSPNPFDLLGVQRGTDKSEIRNLGPASRGVVLLSVLIYLGPLAFPWRFHGLCPGPRQPLQAEGPREPKDQAKTKMWRTPEQRPCCHATNDPKQGVLDVSGAGRFFGSGCKPNIRT